MDKTEKILDRKGLNTPTGWKLLIIIRFITAAALSIFPLFFDLKDEWYVAPLVFINILLQFGVAFIQMHPFIKRLIQTKLK